jgi:hypothetical protein
MKFDNNQMIEPRLLAECQIQLRITLISNMLKSIDRLFKEIENIHAIFEGQR